MIHVSGSFRVRKIIYALFFCFADKGTGAIAGKALIGLLGTLGIGEGQARLCVNRMLASGILLSERRGRRASYSMSPVGIERVQDGEREYYRGADRPFSGLWTMVVYRVPERDRKLRDDLRSFLEFSSFAQLAPSVWIRPDADGRRLEREASSLRDREGIEVTVHAVRFEGDQRDVVGRYWDMADHAAALRRFIDAWGPSVGTGPWKGDGREAFKLFFSMQADWLLASSSDPRLPACLLPDDWPGFDAERVLRAGSARWRASAWRYAEAIISDQSEGSRR